MNVGWGSGDGGEVVVNYVGTPGINIPSNSAHKITCPQSSFQSFDIVILSDKGVCSGQLTQKLTCILSQLSL